MLVAHVEAFYNSSKTTPNTHLHTWTFDFDNDYAYILKLFLAINLPYLH